MNKTLHFIRHYVEMVVAMMLGMAAFSMALGNPYDDAPELALLGMATAMTIPMVAWMRYRGHGWPESWEMTASMFVPTFFAIALLLAGVLESGHAAMGVQHAIMFPAMAAVMLLRGSAAPHHRLEGLPAARR